LLGGTAHIPAAKPVGDILELSADDVAMVEDSLPPPAFSVIAIDEVVEDLPDDAEVPDVPSWSGPASESALSRESWTGIGPPPLTRDQVALSLFLEAAVDLDADE